MHEVQPAVVVSTWLPAPADLEVSTFDMYGYDRRRIRHVRAVTRRKRRTWRVTR